MSEYPEAPPRRSVIQPGANQPEVNLIASADRAMYEAKQNGRNQHRRGTLEVNPVISSSKIQS